MGNRGCRSKTYSVPNFFSVRKIRDSYNNAQPTIKDKMNKIVAIKTNFRVYVSADDQYQLWINDDESMKPNTTTLNIILKSECKFEDIGFLQFNLTDQQLFA